MTVRPPSGWCGHCAWLFAHRKGGAVTAPPVRWATTQPSTVIASPVRWTNSPQCPHHQFRTGVDPTPYSGHSFRNGVSTMAAHQGITHSTIKMVGRWSSSAKLVHRYIHFVIYSLTPFSCVLTIHYNADQIHVKTPMNLKFCM